MPEVSMRDSGREHHIVVIQRLVRDDDRTVRHVDAFHVTEQNGDIGLLSQDMPQRCGDGRCSQPSCCHLVQQGLEGMMVVPVYQQHVDRRITKGSYGPQAGKATPDHDDARTANWRGCRCMVGQGARIMQRCPVVCRCCVLGPRASCPFGQGTTFERIVDRAPSSPSTV
jgi:hypothetical protein